MSFLSEAAKRVSSLGANNPTAYFAVGVACAVTSTVLACRATLKLEDTLDKALAEVDKTEDGAAIFERSRMTAAIKITRLYAPAAIVGIASITLLTRSHNLLVKRNAALSAAYTALDNGFREYRARVVDKYGQEEDDRLRYGVEVETTKVGNKNVKTERFNPETGASIYAVFFDEYNPNWSKDPEINKLFLRAQQNYLNDLLHARGHLFLNEVYDALGFDHSQAGAVVGWILHPDGDNYVDLGVFNDKDPDRVRDFVNGREGSVLLDFNVDGLIYDRIGKKPDVRWQRSRWVRL